MIIDYIFRSKKRNEFSIENVFKKISENLPSVIKYNNIVLPNPEAKSLKKILENIIYVKKNLKGKMHHITGEIHYIAIFLKKKKTILTIHDLVMLENNKGLKKFLIYIFWFYLPILNSKSVTCVSKKTYDDLVKLLPKYRNKYTVINNPLTLNIDSNEKKEYNFKNSRLKFLIIGTRENKNLIRMFKALENQICTLDIVGNLSKDQINILKEYQLKYKNYVNITNKKIIELYKNNDILLFASTYEGFGLPILEAQGCGTIVLTSNLEPMKSVAGKGAVLVDPYNINDIREKINFIKNGTIDTNKIVKDGFDNIKKYDLENIVNSYYKLYNY